MFTSFVLHKHAYCCNDQYAEDYRLELLYDIDEHLKLNQSLEGCSSISVIDIMFYQYLRRSYNLEPNNFCANFEILSQTMPELSEFTNVARLLIHVSQLVNIGYEGINHNE